MPVRCIKEIFEETILDWGIDIRLRILFPRSIINAFGISEDDVFVCEGSGISFEKEVMKQEGSFIAGWEGWGL